MQRRVFVTFLGTAPYQEVSYLPLPLRSGEREHSTAYAPVARIAALEERGEAPDSIPVLATEAAKRANWDAGHERENPRTRLKEVRLRDGRFILASENDGTRDPWPWLRAELEAPNQLIGRVRKWLAGGGAPFQPNRDIVLVQGEHGATFAVVRSLTKSGYRCVHATSERQVQEHVQPDGSVAQRRVFKHVAFRDY